MREQWRLIDSGYGDAYSNMALDEALLLAGIKGHSPPTLRFYGFKPAAVSIGYTQDVARGVNLAACRQAGLALVRRPTGGRGVLHGQELTYSIIAPKDYFPESGVLASYRFIAQGLIQGLHNLGVEASLASPRSGSQTRRQHRSAACFLTHSCYEITVGGRKLIGSAQRRLGTHTVGSHLLQQGSILLEVDYKAIVDLFPNGSGSKPELIRQAQARITSLGELLDQPLKIEELKQKLTQGFKQALAAEFIREKPSLAEQALAQRLYEQKYITRKWNFKGVKENEVF